MSKYPTQGDKFGLNFAIWATFWEEMCFVIAILRVQEMLDVDVLNF